MNRASRVLWVGALIILLLIAAPAGVPKNPPILLIAHALGGIAGKSYTNSLEAFLFNYQRGLRVFEVDLVETEDGHLIARHGWSALDYRRLEQRQYGVDIPSYAEIKDRKINHRLTMLDIDDIMSLMAMHTDAILLTDTKDVDPALIRRKFQKIINSANALDPKVLDRIVPQLYNREMLQEVRKSHPFREYIYTLYASTDSNAEVLKFLAVTPEIRAITIPLDRVEEEFVRAVRRAGRLVHTHTSNDVDQIRYLNSIGISGVYTDFVGPRDLNLQ